MPFQKGQSGNAKGRPKQTAEQKEQKAQFQALLKKATVPALESILVIARDRHHKDCFNACKYIIDKADVNAELSGQEAEPLTIRIIRHRPDGKEEQDMDCDWNL